MESNQRLFDCKDAELSGLYADIWQEIQILKSLLEDVNQIVPAGYEKELVRIENCPDDWDKEGDQRSTHDHFCHIGTYFITSFFVMLISALERNILEICNFIRSDKFISLKVDDLRGGSNKEKSKIFLRKLAGFTVFDEKAWNSINELYKLRNVIIHNGIELDMSYLNSNRKLQSLLEKNIGVKRSETFDESEASHKEIFAMWRDSEDDDEATDDDETNNSNESLENDIPEDFGIELDNSFTEQYRPPLLPIGDRDTFKLNFEWRFCAYCLREMEIFFESVMKEHINCKKRERDIHTNPDNHPIQ